MSAECEDIWWPAGDVCIEIFRIIWILEKSGKNGAPDVSQCSRLLMTVPHELAVSITYCAGSARTTAPDYHSTLHQELAHSQYTEQLCKVRLAALGREGQGRGAERMRSFRSTRRAAGRAGLLNR